MNKGGRAALARSKSIDHQIDEDRERRQKEVQLLILGGAGAGKSTFIKQLRLQYGDHFPESCRQQFTPYVMYNVTCALHVILDQMDTMGIQYDDDHNQRMAKEFRQRHPRLSLQTILTRYKEEEARCQTSCPAMTPADLRVRLTSLDLYVPQVADAEELQLLWTDCGVQCCYARRQKFPRDTLPPTAEYFLEAMDRVMCTDYVPSVQDILYIRWPTLGMQEHSFTVDHLHFKVTDVAGQKSLRKKWIHFFEGVTAVLFFVALSGFDQCVEEEPGTNMMQDSLQAFHEVSHNHFLEKTDFILFLNKKDIFMERIRSASITACFPKYKGPGTFEASLRHIQEQFLQHKPGHKQLYTHVTCAVDVGRMKEVLANVMDKIVDMNVRRAHLH
ncbi:guanine nucleotide-binding protein G(o) subunit alpha-like isoform X2 [Babylonia areolata]